MKTLQLNCLTLFTFFAVGLNAQQWSGSENTSGVIERTGDVRIANANLSLWGNQIIGYTTWDNFTDTDNFTIGNFGLTKTGNKINLSGWAGLNLITNKVNRLSILNNGNIGIGTTTPTSKLHVKSPSKTFNEGNLSTSANLLIQGTNSAKTTGAGAVLGFALPANSNGSNSWQQARIYAGSDNTNNGDASGRMYLQTRYNNNGAWSWRNNLVLRPSGNVGIGTSTPSEKLTVKGKILCEEVEVVIDANAPDYVFEKYYTGISNLKNNYTMLTLEEIEAYTKANHHLPEVPSAKSLKEDGLELKNMSMILLQKIEELTLYTIEQEKRIKALETLLVTKK